MNYLEFCNYRERFQRSGEFDLRNASFFYPTTLLPLLDLIIEHKESELIEPSEPNIMNYITTIQRGDLTSSTSYLPLVLLPPNATQSHPILQRLYQLSESDVFGGHEALKLVIDELVANIYEHSCFTKAMVMAQKYPSKRFTDICFFDDGITITGSLAKCGMIYQEGDAYKAICDALNGLSSKGDKGRGYGLYYSMRIFLEGLRGEVLIVSGTGAVYISNEEKYAYFLSEPFKLGGTLLSVRTQNVARQLKIYDYVE